MLHIGSHHSISPSATAYCSLPALVRFSTPNSSYSTPCVTSSFFPLSPCLSYFEYCPYLDFGCFLHRKENFGLIPFFRALISNYLNICSTFPNTTLPSKTISNEITTADHRLDTISGRRKTKSTATCWTSYKKHRYGAIFRIWFHPSRDHPHRKHVLQP